MTVTVATNLADALAALRATPEARLLQGGTDTMVEINFNHYKPEHIVALRKVEELRSYSIQEDKSQIFIGSGVPYQTLENDPFLTLLPALAQASRTVGSPQIRAAGSLGGNLGTCSPAGDGLPVLSALDAIIHLRSVDDARDVLIHDFMTGVKKNSRKPDEIITGVTVPILNGFQGYSKVGVRNAMVISVASACFVVDKAKAKGCLALGAVGPTIIRCRDTEQWLSEQVDVAASDFSNKIAKEFGRRAALEARPIDDHRSTAEYRRHAISVLAERLLLKANS
jgi:CO/xanthine dehydrogenase FAD-binding subunit